MKPPSAGHPEPGFCAPVLTGNGCPRLSISDSLAQGFVQEVVETPVFLWDGAVWCWGWDSMHAEFVH